MAEEASAEGAVDEALVSEEAQAADVKDSQTDGVEVSRTEAESELSDKAFVSEEAREDGASRDEAGEAPTQPVKVRKLTREERELYAPFIQSRSAREKLVKAIDSISMAAFTGNLIVTGEEGMNAMGLAQRMIKEVKMTDSNFSGKVAKVSGRSLNQRDVEATIRDLNNGALIIKQASGMTKDTAGRLYEVLQQETLGIVVVLVDTKKAMTKLLLNSHRLVECFNARVDLEPLSNATLAAFGQQS